MTRVPRSADNSTPELRARGLQAGSQPVRTCDINVGVGGPIRKDRIWFYGSYRHWIGDTTIANSFYNANPSRLTYRPDLDRQVIDENTIKNGTIRLTMRPGDIHKFSLYGDRVSKFRGHECPALSAEEACGVRVPRNYGTWQAKYTGTPSSRVLIEGGFSVNNLTWSSQQLQPGLPLDAIPRRDLITGTRWSAPITPFQLQSGPRNTLSASASYVTGTHAFKTGMQFGFGTVHQLQSLQTDAGIDLVQEYRNGVPASVTV